MAGRCVPPICLSDSISVVLPTASVEMFEAQRSVIRQLQIGSPRTGALAAELADPGWLGSPPYLALEGRAAHHLPDPNAEQAEAVARVMGMRPGQVYRLAVSFEPDLTLVQIAKRLRICWIGEIERIEAEPAHAAKADFSTLLDRLGQEQRIA